MIKKIIKLFDRFEDKIRFRLSKAPIVYALVGSVGIVLVWKGVWETAELFPILHGFPSFLIGVLILLTSGLLVSFFVGDSIIMSGFKREKKLVEKTQGEIHSEMDILLDIKKKVDSLERSMPLKKDE